MSQQPFDPATLSMTEIIRLQTLLSQELTRRFERQLALMFTDIVESTRYLAEHGDEAGRRLQQLHFDLLAQQAEAHQGRIVDTAGDGAFLCFASAAQAARAAVALQRAITVANQDRPRQHQLSVRVGLHWGPALTDGQQVTGESVNLCARIVATSQPGQIRLSRELLLQLEPAQREGCMPLPPVPLKGIARAVELLDLPWRDPSLFPSHLVVRESGERIALPQLDTLCFGRGELHGEGAAVHVILALVDPVASKQVSHRHFELLARPTGFVIRSLSSQPTEVDGVSLARDQELPLRPDSVVRLARVMTLEFAIASGVGESTDDGTMMSPQHARPVAGDTQYIS